jgi:hypothetical protein
MVLLRWCGLAGWLGLVEVEQGGDPHPEGERYDDHDHSDEHGFLFR